MKFNPSMLAALVHAAGIGARAVHRIAEMEPLPEVVLIPGGGRSHRHSRKGAHRYTKRPNRNHIRRRVRRKHRRAAL